MGKCYSFVYGRLEYKVGEYVYNERPGHFLFVLKTLKSARNFIENASGVIYECECEGVEDNPEFIKNFTQQFAEGTTFAHGVKLIKRVDEPKPTPKLEHLDEIIGQASGNKYYVMLNGDGFVHILSQDGEYVNTAKTSDVEFNDDTDFSINHNFCYKKTGKKVRIGAIFP